MAKDPQPHFLTPFVAGVLAWIIPGAGHVYLGRTLRGIIIFLCINAMFWAGVVVGGVFTVDPRNEHWWYMAQMVTGASAAASWYRQKNAHVDVRRKAEAVRDAEARRDPNSRLSQIEAEERVLSDKNNRLALTYPSDVVARAYTGIAGMLNALCIFDAFMLASMGANGEPKPPPRRRRHRGDSDEDDEEEADS